MKILSASDLQPVSRPVDGHKGTFGRVLVIAGSVGMSGAAALAGSGALRGGAGLVTVMCPAAVRGEVAGHNPCYTTIGMECRKNGLLRPQNAAAIASVCKGQTAIAIGPGLGTSAAVRDLVRVVLDQADCPLVLDADALNVAAEFDLLDHRKHVRPRVLTPHPGEFARLTGLSVPQINRAREASAAHFAERHGVTVVLKGSKTVVTNGSDLYVNETGNSGLATGGSGDVLTGLLAAQLALGLSSLLAAARAVHVHGIAGELASAQVSETGLIATDLLDYLGPAWLRFAANLRP